MNGLSKAVTAGAASLSLLAGCSGEFAPTSPHTTDTPSSAPASTTPSEQVPKLSWGVCDAIDSLTGALGAYSNVPGGGGRPAIDIYLNGPNDGFGEAVFAEGAVDMISDAIKAEQPYAHNVAYDAVSELMAKSMIVDRDVTHYLKGGPSDRNWRAKNRYLSPGRQDRVGLTKKLEAARKAAYVIMIEYCGSEAPTRKEVYPKDRKYFPTPAPVAVSIPDGERQR